MRRRLLRMMTAAVATTAIAAVTAPAFADDTPAVTRLHNRADAEITRRLATLDRLTEVVNSAKLISGDDRTALVTKIVTDRAGLTELKATIDADSNLATLRPEVRRIVTDFRVYVLLEPQVR